MVYYLRVSASKLPERDGSSRGRKPEKDDTDPLVKISVITFFVNKGFVKAIQIYANLVITQISHLLSSDSLLSLPIFWKFFKAKNTFSMWSNIVTITLKEVSEH